ncbi:hypothetical protein KIPB_010402, partial [Kipferlia bialata]|eukprot:g10402.t1
MSLSDIGWSKVDVGFKARVRSALAYLGPLGPDGVSPASTLKEGEHYSAMIVGNNNVIDTGLCVVLSEDPETDRVSKKVVPCPISPSRVGLSATRIGDSVYVFGGSDGCGRRCHCLDDLYCYCIPGKKWTKIVRKGEWPRGRRNHSAFTLGGKLYIVGGYSEYGPLKDCWCYDPKTEGFSQKPDAPLPFPVSSPVVVGDRAHLVGNWIIRGASMSMHLSYSEIEGWVSETDMPFKVSPVATVSTGTDIVVVGGSYRSKVHLVYNTLTKGWREGGDIPVAFTVGRACLLSPTRIVVHCMQGVVLGTLAFAPAVRRERNRAADEAAMVEREKAEAEAERQKSRRLERERRRVRIERAAKVEAERCLLQSLLAGDNIDPTSVYHSFPSTALIALLVAKLRETGRKMQSLEERDSERERKLQSLEERDSEREKKLHSLEERDSEREKKLHFLEERDSERERKVLSLEERHSERERKVHCLEERDREREIVINSLEEREGQRLTPSQAYVDFSPDMRETVQALTQRVKALDGA